MIDRVEMDFDRCYRAVDSRDQRFDGWFYTAVTSTGIYCRPSCPAATPKPANVRFFPTAAAAQRAGFRACKRCRPDAAPGSPAWDVRADLVARAMRLIADGVVDREGVPGLARRLGYTERHLNRMVTAELGAGPLALARAQRAQTARTLIETTGLGLAEIAFAAGFGSVRQFNDTILQVYAATPSALREAAVGRAGAGGTGTVSLRLAYRPPLHAGSLLEFFAHRAIPGVESVEHGTYRRALALPHGRATVALTPQPGYVAATLHLTDVRDLAPAVARCRRLLDLDADPVAVDATLAADPVLAPSVAKEPGVRLPRAVDGFEMAVRAIVGQQISVSAARTVLAKLVTAASAAHTAASHPTLVPHPDGSPRTGCTAAGDAPRPALTAPDDAPRTASTAAGDASRMTPTASDDAPHVTPTAADDAPPMTPTASDDASHTAPTASGDAPDMTPTASDDAGTAPTAADGAPRARANGASRARALTANGDAGGAVPDLVPFPTAAQVAELPDAAFAMPAARRETIRGLARAVAAGSLDLDPGADRTETEHRLLELPGIGAWTAGYLAIRALGDPDVFLHTDLGVQRGAQELDLPMTTLAAYAQRWSPWRSYAVIRLWRHA
nr:AlkA N-terminal domain-containing protein [Micromonospora sp. NBRC 107566]